MVGARARMRLNHRLMLTTKAVNKHWRFTLARPRYLRPPHPVEADQLGDLRLDPPPPLHLFGE